MPLLTYDEALARLLVKVHPLERTEFVSVSRASRRVLAQPVTSQVGNPRFTNSAVDGYAVGCAKDAAAKSLLFLSGEVAAGGTAPTLLEAGCALRVFTGAALPPNVYAVVMQEDCEAVAGKVAIGRGVAKGAGVRLRGEEFEVGEVLLSKGDTLNAGGLAILSWEGFNKVEVVALPRVAVISTGDELCESGGGLSQLNDSNGPMLCELARVSGANIVAKVVLPDAPDLIRRVLSESACDLILVSGGMSVGDHDHVPKLVAELGEVIFHGAKIKPGKPVLAGRLGDAIVVGLPGNPASAFVCFHLLAKPAIRKMLSANDGLGWFTAVFDGNHEADDREVFARCSLRYEGGKVLATPVGEQGSFGLQSLADGDSLARLESGRDYKPGDTCSVSLI